MAVKVRDITNEIELLAPLSTQEGWDNSGLMVGELDIEVKGVLLALDCTEEVIDKAIDIGANLIVTHHPLIFKGLTSVGSSTYVERCVKKLIKEDITLYSAHTNLDKMSGGVSALMADKINLIEREILSPNPDGGGLGIIGTLPQPMEVPELLSLVKERFGSKMVRTSRSIDGVVERVALCGGSGSSLIEKAYLSGAQLYITGDISYHHYFCEEHFMVVDIGHFESEIGVLHLLEKIILKKIANLALHKITEVGNPINYF
ncbi:MAG: Nif3-like dinuclear metal center hexameric protein [Bacteroidales bacterium]